MATRLERLMFAIGMRDEASAKMGRLRKAVTAVTETVHDQFLRVGTGAMGAYSQMQSLQQIVAPAIDLNRALGEVASLGRSDLGLAVLQREAEQFAMAYGGSAANVVRAGYEIQSAIDGLTDKELARFTAASGVLAKASKADVATMTSYMGTMYGIFKQTADKAGKTSWVEAIAGQTAYAVGLFKSSGPEMSAAFTSLGANATAAGRDVAEQMGVLGSLQATMSGSEAGTKYKAFLAGVGNAQKELGLKLTDKDGNMLGMVDILDKVKGKFGETLDVAESDALKKAFGSDEAVSLIKQLMINTDGLKNNIANIANIKNMAPAEKMAARMTDIWAQMGGGISVLSGKFVQALLPPLEDVVGKVFNVVNTLVRWIEIAPNLARWIGYGAITVMALAAVMGMFSAVIAVNKIALLALGGPIKMVASLFGLLRKLTILQTAAQWLFNAALWANPMTWVVMGIVALVVAVGALIYWWDDLKAAFLDTSWGKAIMAVIDSLMAPFKALGDTWDWLSQKIGFGGSTEVTTTAISAAQAAELPKAPATLSSISAPRVSEIPVGGVLANSSIQNRTNTRQTSIGSVTINSEQPMTPGQMNEWALLQAG